MFDKYLIPLLLLIAACNKDPLPTTHKNVAIVTDKDSISENIGLVETIMKEKAPSCKKACDLSLLYLKEATLSHNRICNITKEPENITIDQDIELIKKFMDKCKKRCKK